MRAQRTIGCPDILPLILPNPVYTIEKFMDAGSIFDLFSIPALDCSRTLFLAFDKYQNYGDTFTFSLYTHIYSHTLAIILHVLYSFTHPYSAIRWRALANYTQSST